MKADELNWNEVTGGMTKQRLAIAQQTLDKLSPEEQHRARLEECADERTGRRYGLAKKRQGQAIKVGGGGRNRGSGNSYQVWLVWN